MVGIIQDPLDVVVTVVQVHQFLPQKISLPNMTLLVLDTASQLASLAVLGLGGGFSFRATKGTPPTQGPTSKIMGAGEHNSATGGPNGQFIWIHPLPAAGG